MQIDNNMTTETEDRGRIDSEVNSILFLIFRKEMDPTSLEFFSVKKKLDSFTKKQIADFYIFFSASTEYFNSAGFGSFPLLDKAMRDFKENEMGKIWKEAGMENTKNILSEKLSSIYTVINRDMPSEKQETVLIEGFDKFKKKDTNEPFLSSEEITLMSAESDRRRTFYIYSSEGTGRLKEELETIIKRKITKDLFKKKGKTPTMIGKEKHMKMIGNAISRF